VKILLRRNGNDKNCHRSVVGNWPILVSYILVQVVYGSLLLSLRLPLSLLYHPVFHLVLYTLLFHICKNQSRTSSKLNLYPVGFYSFYVMIFFLQRRNKEEKSRASSFSVDQFEYADSNRLRNRFTIN